MTKKKAFSLYADYRCTIDALSDEEAGQLSRRWAGASGSSTASSRFTSRRTRAATGGWNDDPDCKTASTGHKPLITCGEMI